MAASIMKPRGLRAKRARMCSSPGRRFFAEGMAMRATSLASADREQPQSEGAPKEAAPPQARPSSGWDFYAEAAPHALNALLRPALHQFRQGWLYRQTLRGPMPDRILFYPTDTRVRRLDDADALIRGRFRF